METGAEAVRLLDQQERRSVPRHLLFLDADLGDTAQHAGPLAEPVRGGEADMTMAVFSSTVKLGGHGFVVKLSGAGIERATGWRPAQPLNGQRCLTRAAFDAARPIARGFGAETALTIDLLRRGNAGHRGGGAAGAPGHRDGLAFSAAPCPAVRRRGQGPGPTAMSWRRGVPAGTPVRGGNPPGSSTAPGNRAPAGGTAAPGGGRLRAAIPARAGLGATVVSIALTLTVAVLGPSVMEPALPGRPGQPPWAFAAHPSAYLAVALTFAAIVAGSFGLAVTMRAARLGWIVSPQVLLTTGLIAAAVLVLLPPFGSSDHLSYAAYGRMLATGHNPYLTTPNQLARLGDPIARAVEDWRTSPSVYGVLATGGQALASLIGGTSVRLTVFVLSLLNLAGFAVTGLLLHRLAAGDRSRQLRAALLWTCNPLLLLVLVAGEHVDSQAIVFGVAAVAAFALAMRRAAAGATWRCVPWAFAAGLLAGLGFAVKLSMLLVAVGLAAACLLTWPARPDRPGTPQPGMGRPGTGQPGRLACRGPGRPRPRRWRAWPPGSRR